MTIPADCMPAPAVYIIVVRQLKFRGWALRPWGVCPGRCDARSPVGPVVLIVLLLLTLAGPERRTCGSSKQRLRPRVRLFPCSPSRSLSASQLAGQETLRAEMFGLSLSARLAVLFNLWPAARRKARRVPRRSRHPRANLARLREDARMAVCLEAGRE